MSFTESGSSPMDDQGNRVTETSDLASTQSERRWTPLSSRQRRVLGVLIEKAKTTPDAYPMTINAITNGCNQKSNRKPQMELTQDDIEEILDELRQIGAIGEVQGGGRVAKFRHYAYEWFDVDKREVAVLAELLLRGEQTLGDLRARASRMENIPDQAELRSIVDSLLAKELMIEMTPRGRGQIVNHGVYTEREMEKIEKIDSSSVSRDSFDRSTYRSDVPNTPVQRSPVEQSFASPTSSSEDDQQSLLAEALAEIKDLKLRVERLEQRISSEP